MAAARLLQLPGAASWLRVPSNGGPLLDAPVRLTSGLETLDGVGVNHLVAKGVTPSRPQVNRSKGPPVGGTLTFSTP